MKILKNKLKKQGGFTLVEMLTVVAIIAILIAISIPMVTGALDRAKKATDAANVRAAKAAMSIESLTKTSYADGTVMAYNAATGALAEYNAEITEYGKSKDATIDNTEKIIFVMEYDDVVYYQWATPKNPSGATDGKVADKPADETIWKTAVEPNDF